jgi:Tfp pilus assembly protein PilX
MTDPRAAHRTDRGMAIVVVLGIVALLLSIASFAIVLSQQERKNAGKEIHNASIQEMTESTLQLARNFFAANYFKWGSYLAYFVDNPVQIKDPTAAKTYVANLKTAHPELFANPPSGYDCFMYAQDNVDEFPPVPNDPKRDNDLLIYIGAVCIQQQQGGSTQRDQLIGELSAPLLYSPTANIYRSQASGGSQDNNNTSVVAGYR